MTKKGIKVIQGKKLEKNSVHLAQDAAMIYDRHIAEKFPDWKLFIRPTVKNEHMMLKDKNKEVESEDDITSLAIPEGEGLYTLVVISTQFKGLRVRIILTNEEAKLLMSLTYLPIAVKNIYMEEALRVCGIAEKTPNIDGIVGLDTDKAKVLLWWEPSFSFEEHYNIPKRYLEEGTPNITFAPVPDDIKYPVFSSFIYYLEDKRYHLDYMEVIDVD
ncbi:MAG TPA: hypothetical protein P5136_01710 [Methanofastidiosum sp.]|nr:hypothetical protein [Methanofastidiosum sp.]